MRKQRGTQQVVRLILQKINLVKRSLEELGICRKDVLMIFSRLLGGDAQKKSRRDDSNAIKVWLMAYLKDRQTGTAKDKLLTLLGRLEHYTYKIEKAEQKRQSNDSSSFSYVSEPMQTPKLQSIRRQLSSSLRDKSDDRERSRRIQYEMAKIRNLQQEINKKILREQLLEQLLLEDRIREELKELSFTHSRYIEDLTV